MGQNHSLAHTNRLTAWQASLLSAALLCAPATRGAPLDAAAQKATRAATFEVVARKPPDDSVTYEKPLPLELIPYAIRSDDYHPIGTAFAIGPNEYVSAAHVFAAAVGSQYGDPVLRDEQRRIYEIDRILKFSMHEDFIVFSLRDPPAVKPLALNRKPELNGVVYAIGNALGDGIVIRDGLYTSDTPEDINGRWKWLRFSAAASPGSSGGPLLDASGKVMGVVLAASPKENLNYAVSIDQVITAPASLRIDTRAPYRLSIMPDTITNAFKEELASPMSWPEFETAQLLWLNQPRPTGASRFSPPTPTRYSPGAAARCSCSTPSTTMPFRASSCATTRSAGTRRRWVDVSPSSSTAMELWMAAVRRALACYASGIQTM
ncbi:MAG: trypsin-like peptidase domain-containing protein [Gammaproteobacteria bacterium]|nr:trypsin-like peptidase domain-containing protein [Gammaproteobacteria bacterium]